MPSWDSHNPYLITEKYDYVLELDSNNRIVGGSHNTWDRPDFAWKMEIGDFSNYFGSLRQIYETSVNGTSASYMRSRDRSARIRETLNHEDLTKRDGCFGTPVNYPNNHKMSWSIRPSKEDVNKQLVISFISFTTERYRDKVKIYEGASGEGALVAVLHGEDVPEDIQLATSSAYIVFKSDEVVNNKGFQACFTWV